jgi:hypothetical protein
MIQGIEHIDSKLKLGCLGHFEILGQRDLGAPGTGIAEEALARSARPIGNTTGRRDAGEYSGIEVLEVAATAKTAARRGHNLSFLKV